MDTVEQITRLVEDYNVCERLQAERLTKLYKLMGTRKGYRKVSFSGPVAWTNLWSLPDELAIPRAMEDLHREITGVTLGDE